MKFVFFFKNKGFLNWVVGVGPLGKIPTFSLTLTQIWQFSQMHMNEKIYILILKSYLSPFIRIFRFNVEWWKYILSQYLNYMQYKLSITAWQDLNKGNLFLPWLAFENIFCTFLFTSTPILTSMDDVMKRWIHFEITCQNWHKLWQICPINRYQIWSVMEHMKAAFKLIQKTQKWMCFDKKVEMLWWHVFWQNSISCSQNPSSHLGNQIWSVLLFPWLTIVSIDNDNLHYHT